MKAKLLKFISAYAADTRGVTMIEYGLFIGGLGLVVAASAFIIGDDISGVFTSLGEFLESNVGGPGN